MWEMGDRRGKSEQERANGKVRRDHRLRRNRHVDTYMTKNEITLILGVRTLCLVPWGDLGEAQAHQVRDGGYAALLRVRNHEVVSPSPCCSRTRNRGPNDHFAMLGARGDRVSASRRKLTQALEQDRLALTPQVSVPPACSHVSEGAFTYFVTKFEKY